MTNYSSISGIILAAGKGTRIKSELPKCVHSVCDVSMVEHVARAMRGAGALKPAVVVGYQAEVLKSSLGEGYFFAHQEEQLGTGHATLMAQSVLDQNIKTVFIAPGDAPLLTSEVFENLLKHHQESHAKLTLATCRLEDPKGYGRVVRNDQGLPVRIVEEKDGTPEILSIKEVCTGVYCVETEFLWKYLPKLSSSNAQNEYYLTDLIEHLSKNEQNVQTVCFEDQNLFLGVNDRWQLAQANQIMQQRILKSHALNGVTLMDLNSIQIGADVEIESDAIIGAMTVLKGKTQIGSGSQIGPFSMINNSKIGKKCEILMSQVQASTIQDGARCGPFANIRPHTVLSERAKIGNFVEVKNALIGEKVSVSHLSYVGDAVVGAHTNIGAGTITCNYDGYAKHQTEIGSNVFVGSNSTLIAPITVQDGAIIGAGSVITKNVPSNALGLGRSKQENKESWAIQWRQRKQQSK